MPYIPLTINSSQKFRDGIDKILEYRDSFDAKIDTALERLANEGISICYSNSIFVDDGKSYGNLILFTYTQDSSYNGYGEVVLTGSDIGKIVSRWRYKGGIKEAEVSPLLMAEFGSGNFAENPLNVGGVGQGTFPNQKHAFEAEWHWTDEAGVYHRSSGIKPTQPMFRTRNYLLTRVATVFDEVFH